MQTKSTPQDNNAKWISLSKEQAESHPLFGTSRGWSLALFVLLILTLLGKLGNSLGMVFTYPEAPFLALLFDSFFWVWGCLNVYLLWAAPKLFKESFLVWCVGAIIFSGIAGGSTDGMARQIGSYMASVIPGVFHVIYSKRFNVTANYRVRPNDPWFIENFNQPANPVAKAKTEIKLTQNESSNTEKYLPEVPQPVLLLKPSQVVDAATLSSNTIGHRLENVKDLFDRGLISDEEAAQKRKEILNDL